MHTKIQNMKFVVEMYGFRAESLKHEIDFNETNHLTENLCIPCPVPLSACCPTLSFLLWSGTSCVVARRNIKRAGIPVPDAALSPEWNCPWKARMLKEIATSPGGWLGSLVFQDEGFWLLPSIGHVAGKDGPLWLSQKRIDWHKRGVTRVWVMRSPRWAKRISTEFIVEYVDISCVHSFQFFPIFT